MAQKLIGFWGIVPFLSISNLEVMMHGFCDSGVVPFLVKKLYEFLPAQSVGSLSARTQCEWLPQLVREPQWRGQKPVACDWLLGPWLVIPSHPVCEVVDLFFFFFLGGGWASTSSTEVGWAGLVGLVGLDPLKVNNC